jgi:DNA (cytosine-5)-methyltransferase 1
LYKVIDLFCGAGGLTLGIQQCGFQVCFAIDHDPAAVETYRRNLGDHVICGEVSETLSIPAADVIVGGPPCQGFSSAGPRRPGDQRNSLVGVFAELIIRHKPRAFVFENVEGFLTAESGQRVFELLDPLVSAGYCIHLRKINAANYGVPQHRKRVLAIGGLGWSPSFPPATRRAFGAPGASVGGNGLPPAATLSDAFRRLPAGTTEPDTCKLSDHYCRPISEEDLNRIQNLEQGQTMRDLPEDLWHDSFKRRAYRRVMDGTPTERRGGAPAGIRRLRIDEPSKAITGGSRSEFVHPLEHRYLTLRECARIQTFPDTFEFGGTSAERSLQIGNAVPPDLAVAIGNSLLSDLTGHPTPTTSEGQLLSFVPTVSNGMSPALQDLSSAVLKRFGNSRLKGDQLSLWR